MKIRTYILRKGARGIALALCFSSSSVISAETQSIVIEKLKGRIIRSVSVANFDNQQIIVGNKGGDAGDAIVFSSNNGGISWRFLNGGSPLHSQATDVQAVAYISQQIVMAGTWKHGLYRSLDAGESFTKVDSFAAKDVRSFAVAKKQSNVLFAATGANGIFKSTDSGASWSATTLANGYFWSVQAQANGERLTASSPNKGLFLSNDSGESWQSHLPKEAVYDAKYSPQTSDILIAATDNGLFLSLDAGLQWQQPDALRGKQLRSVSFDSTDPSILTLGDWSGGIWNYSLTTGSASQFHKHLRTLHTENSQHALMLGTWGGGLYILPHSSNTPYLIAATKAGDIQSVNALLATGANPDSFDELRNTSLTFASRDGQLEIATGLLNSGADVNWIDAEGVSPLILASHKNHPQVVALLLANNADKTVVDSFGNTAAQYARRRGANDKIFQMLAK